MVKNRMFVVTIKQENYAKLKILFNEHEKKRRVIMQSTWISNSNSKMCGLKFVDRKLHSNTFFPLQEKIHKSLIPRTNCIYQLDNEHLNKKCGRFFFSQHHSFLPLHPFTLCVPLFGQFLTFALSRVFVVFVCVFFCCYILFKLISWWWRRWDVLSIFKLTHTKLSTGHAHFDTSICTSMTWSVLV